MKWFFKRVHLIVSVIVVIPIGIIYGSSMISQFLNIQVETIDLANQMKAIMFLYLGMSLIWLLGIFKNDYWQFATQLNAIFMLSLATGRMISMIFDGWPTFGYVFGICAELLLGSIALVQLNRNQKNAS